MEIGLERSGTMTSTFNNFAKNYLSKLYLPRLTWTDVIEIIIIAFLLYNVLVWIKNTKAWALLKGIIVEIGRAHV